MVSVDDRTAADLRTAVTKRCTDKDMRDVILYGIAVADRVRLTKSGITFYGPNGSANTHFTTSDWRARQNLIRDLRQAGL
jgi:hypothetical protein